MMATFQAIGSVAEAVARLLGQAWQPSLLNGTDSQFEVYQGKDFSKPMDLGVSVFVYQVGVNKVQRTLPPADPQHRRPLPLDIWLLLTAWARTPRWSTPSSAGPCGRSTTTPSCRRGS